MAHLRGLAKLGVEVSPPYMGDWPLKIGQYMLNFGAIEYISYQYLNSLEVSRTDFNKNLDRLLSQRIDRILSLLAAVARLSPSEKSEINDLWMHAKELSQWRNRIAHNPVLPTWYPGSDSDRDPPDLIGIPDMKQLKTSDASNSLSMPLLDKLIGASHDVAAALHTLSVKISNEA
jgi:hypothetical protein